MGEPSLLWCVGTFPLETNLPVFRIYGRPVGFPSVGSPTLDLCGFSLLLPTDQTVACVLLTCEDRRETARLRWHWVCSPGTQ